MGKRSKVLSSSMDYGFYRNSWHAENFQEPRNIWSNAFPQKFKIHENPQPWNVWSTGSFQESRNNEYLQTRSPRPSATFQQTETSKNLPPSPKNAEAFKKVKNNENRQNSPKYISKDFIPRKRYRKNRNRSKPRLNRAINGNLEHSSFEWGQQGYQAWNHVPVWDWSQPNLYPQPDFQNSFKRNRDKIPRLFQNSTFTNKRFNKSNNTSTNFLDSNHSNVTPGNAVSCSNFKPSNHFNDSGSIKSNNFSHSSISSYNSNSAANNESKKSKINSSNFNDFNKPNNDDDDIAYLFSVDSSSEKKIVLEVDLQSNSTNLISKSSNADDHSNKESKGANADQSKITLEGKHDISKPQISRKRKSPEFVEQNRKRTCYQPTCEVCKMRYDDIIQNSEDMYISTSCRHIFCSPCISKYGNTTVCPTCGIKCLLFRRLYI